MAFESLTVENLWVTPEGRRRPVVKGLDFALRSGEVKGLLGRSGSGKTTVLRAVNGLIPWFSRAAVEGSIVLDGDEVNDLDPGQRAHLMGTCLDRPEGQLFLPTPRDEFRAAEALYGRPEWLRDLEAPLGIETLMDRRILELSSGERQRVALALALSAAPKPVLLDEPTAHLDGSGVRALRRALGDLARNGGGAVVTEQAGWRLAGAVDGWWSMEEGAALEVEAPKSPAIPGPRHEAGSDPVLEARKVVVKVGGKCLLGPLDLVLKAGEVVVLTGPNGAGKSSLARVLTGHARAADGTLRHFSSRPPSLMLPGPHLQLFERTVAGEVGGRGASVGDSARVLRRHRLEALAARAPWTLSRGERQRLVHAAHDVLQPRVMVVDEPAQGLDPDDLVDLVDLIHRRAEKGRAYLMITHREELVAAAHRHLRVAEGRLEEVS